MVAEKSDSLYHISIQDININFFKREITVTNLKLWADTIQANNLRQQKRYAPNTVSYLSAPRVELRGIKWGNILSGKSFDCAVMVAYNGVWFMETKTHHPDYSYTDEPQGRAMVTRFSAGRLEIINPDVTYHYVGDNNTYFCYLKGGNAVLNNWAIDRDVKKDTSTFLYAANGSVTPQLFRLDKDGKEYTVLTPNINFESSPNSITLKNVAVRHMEDVERSTGHMLESYNFDCPAIEVDNFNWKKLLHNDVLIASNIHTTDPFLEVHYQRNNFSPSTDRMGKYPHQLIREFIKTYIGALTIENGRIEYNEPYDKGEEALFQFDNISGSFNNITNIDRFVKRDDTCIVKLEGRFMHKSPVKATFHLSLSDTMGRFSVDGYVNNLNGNDISKQAAAFTFAKVTSFHLRHMECHVEGDQSYAQGNYTMLYNDLKISLLKFKSDEREKKKGPFSFLADAAILYPDNPMKGEAPRTTSTQLRRNPNNGFLFLIWQNIYLGAQKTAVRSDKMIALAGGTTDTKGKDEPKKRNIFQRLFGKKK